MPEASQGSSRRGRPRDRALALIALFKFAKAGLLVALGLGAVELLRPSVSERAQEWLGVMALSSDRAVVQQVLAWLTGLTHRRLQVLGLAAFLYASLFIIEGIGLWQGRRWAEYLTVIATGSFIPVEVYELVRRVTWTRAAGLGINIVVVAYLIYRLRQPERASGGLPPSLYDRR